MGISLLLLAFAVARIAAQSTCPNLSCGSHLYLDYGTVYFVSPNFPFTYSSNLDCLWIVDSPPFSALQLHCNYFDLAPSVGCTKDTFSFSPSGDCTMSDERKYCGKGHLAVTTMYNRFAVRFKSQNEPSTDHYGFYCFLSVVHSNGGGEWATPDPNPPVVITAGPGGNGDCQCGAKEGSRIVGGQETGVNEWPWQGALRQVSGGSIICGASVISENWLVTAAHCLNQFQTSEIFVSLGEHDQTVSGESSFTIHHEIAQTIIHESYNTVSQDNDIGLIRLSQPVNLNEGVKPICLPFQFASESFQGETATVTGWGTTLNQGVPSDVLLEVELPIVTTSECQAYEIVSEQITENMLCTYEEGKDACQGDSGGPLQLKRGDRYYLVGIVSWGFGCADEDSPGVYTKVTNYLQWIEQQTGANLCSE